MAQKQDVIIYFKNMPITVKYYESAILIAIKKFINIYILILFNEMRFNTLI